MADAASMTGSPERPGTDESGGGYTPLLLGAGVTVLFAFVPLAPLGGGGLAGYLDRNRTGLRAGALAGVGAVVPIVLVLLFFLSMAAVVAGTFAGLVSAVPYALLFFSSGGIVLVCPVLKRPLRKSADGGLAIGPGRRRTRRERTLDGRRAGGVVTAGGLKRP